MLMAAVQTAGYQKDSIDHPYMVDRTRHRALWRVFADGEMAFFQIDTVFFTLNRHGDRSGVSDVQG